MKNSTLLSAVLVTTFAGTAIAEQTKTTICKNGNLERKIEVTYPERDDAVCEVQYTKGDDMKVLWSAKADRGYCDEKATAFIEKQQGWGWQCDAKQSEVEKTDAEKPKRKTKSEPNYSEEKISML